MADLDADAEVGDLYAGLEDQVTAALAAAGESGDSNAKDSVPTTEEEEEADDNEAVDLGDGAMYYSSDSEDDLRIVLNEEAGSEPPGPPLAARCAEAEVGMEVQELSGRAVASAPSDGCRSKFAGSQSKGFHSNSIASMSGYRDWDRHHAVQKEFYFFLPRNRTIFDINIEAFRQKPWRQHGVDISEYFNFGLDEESWRIYCLHMDQFRQRMTLHANETLGLNQELLYDLKSVKVMPSGGSYSGFEERSPEKPKGRAIQVESGGCERLPTADMWRPRQRDSDVVIQINMETSPSILSTSAHSSTVHSKSETTERTFVDHCEENSVNDTSFVAERDVDMEAYCKGSLDANRSKHGSRRYSAAAKQLSSGALFGNARASCPADLDTNSEASTEDCYFKRARRHDDAKALDENNELQEAVADYYFCDKKSAENGESDDHSHADDQGCDKTKLKRRELPSPGKGISYDSFMNCQSDKNFLKSGYEATSSTQEQHIQSLATRKNAIVEKHGKMSVSYTSERHAGNYAHKRSGGDFQSNDMPIIYNNKRHAGKYKLKRSVDNFQNSHVLDVIHKQKSEKRGDLLRSVVHANYGECYLRGSSNEWYRQSPLHEVIDEHVKECFSSAKDLQSHHEHKDRRHSMLKAELNGETDEPLYSEKCFEEKSRRCGLSHNLGNELVDHSACGFKELRRPEIRGKYGDKMRRFAEHNENNWRHLDHLGSQSRGNGKRKNAERCWPDSGFLRQQPPVSSSSRNRCVDSRSIPCAKVMHSKTEYCSNGPDRCHQKRRGCDISFPFDSIEKADVYTSAVVETASYVTPVKRRTHVDKNSVDSEDLVELSFPKGRSRRHKIGNRPLVSGRKLYAAQKLYVPSKEIAREAASDFDDLRNINIISNIFNDKRRVLVDLDQEANCMHLNEWERKFTRQCKRVRYEDESNRKADLTTDNELKESRYSEVRRKMPRLYGSSSYSGNQCPEKMVFQKQQISVSRVSGDDRDNKIEEGALIEELDHQGAIPRTKDEKPRKVVIKSVIEVKSSGEFDATDVISKDVVSKGGAIRECDSKRILEAMEKMQKRRERFKEPIAQKKEEESTKVSLAVLASTEDVKSQRPVRKQRWGTG